jgi:hypothetical protein
MPPRAGHLPNVVERVALQELKAGELPAQRIGSHTVIANLLSKGWIERGSTARNYRITPAGTEALRRRLPE